MTKIIFDETVSQEVFNYNDLDSTQQIIRLPLLDTEFKVSMLPGLKKLYVNIAYDYRAKYEIHITEIEEIIVGNNINTIIPKVTFDIKKPIVNKITIKGQGKEINIISNYTGPDHKLEVNLSNNTVLNLSLGIKENVTVNYPDYTYNFWHTHLKWEEEFPEAFKCNLRIPEIKDFRAIVEAPVNQQAREEYFKKYALDNGYDISDEKKMEKKLIEYFINDLLPSFIPIPSIGQKSLKLATTSEVYCDITILSNDNAADIIGDNFNSTANIDFIE